MNTSGRGRSLLPSAAFRKCGIVQKYKALAEATPGVYFVGRLATYKYYNMDQVVAQALTIYTQLSRRERLETVAGGQ